MPSDALLDFANLLEPIPGDEPAGVPVPLVERQQLDRMRKDQELNPDNPTGDPVARQPEWPAIIKKTTDLLKKKSKDLTLAARLAEALARQHGFAGLRDGLHLLADLVEQCWDNDASLEKPRLYPAPDEGESMEVRAAPFHWLCDAERAALFPVKVRDLPLVLLSGTPHSFQDRQRAIEGKNELSASDFDNSDPLHPQIADDLQQCLDELARLDTLLTDKLGQDAPNLQTLRQAVEDCQSLVKKVTPDLSGYGEQASSASNGSTSSYGDSSAGGSDLERLPRTRAQAYEQLSRIADVLETLEPHSPIPDLIRRAVELGKMPFRQLIGELTRDGGQLAALLQRQFGGHEGEAPA